MTTIEQDETLVFDNGFDDSTTVMHPMFRPSYQDILDLPLNSEVVCFWGDGSIEAYTLDGEFVKNLTNAVAESGDSLGDWSGAFFVAAVIPEKMHPDILAKVIALREGMVRGDS